MRRRKRSIFFVCNAISNNQLISLKLEARTIDKARTLFRIQNNIDPETIFGPFYSKKIFPIKSTNNIQFTGTSQNAIYNGWIVRALFLKQPEYHAYLLFDKREDDKKMQKPSGTYIVRRSELKPIKTIKDNNEAEDKKTICK